MVYLAGVSSPVTVEFFRSVGATDFHFGMLGGIPMVMLFMQFIASYVASSMASRKKAFLWLLILSRLMYIPIAFLPILFPSLARNTLVSVMILLVAVSSALTNFGNPLWFSWMADLIPRRVLNTYWGTRQRWTYVTWTTSYLAVAAFTCFAGLPVTTAFPIMVVLAVCAGITDISLFAHVKEPPNTVVSGKPVLKALLEPVWHPEYRTFMAFSCIWSMSVMIAAAFMQLYTLKVLGVTEWQATLIWCVGGVGVAITAPGWGRIADKHGHRPVLIICVSFKSIVALVFLLVTPACALWVLPVTFLFDGALNAGTMIASNGYMMKTSPKENRSIYISTITALPGICGGFAAIWAGSLLQSLSGASWMILGRVWINYHVVFLLSMVMRLACIALIRWVREPKSSPTSEVLNDLFGVWVSRLLEFPVVWYNRGSVSAGEEKERKDGNGR